LLEEAGMKGKRLGDMMFSPLHANFLINAGRGTSAAALELLDEARARVRANSGIELEYEVKQWLP
jgi:UDP-N-acetylmuramate dehydrogenase